jgi:S-adenosylhomocysteine hydrolase
MLTIRKRKRGQHADDLDRPEPIRSLSAIDPSYFDYESAPIIVEPSKSYSQPVEESKEDVPPRLTNTYIPQETTVVPRPLKLRHLASPDLSSQTLSPPSLVGMPAASSDDESSHSSDSGSSRDDDAESFNLGTPVGSQANKQFFSSGKTLFTATSNFPTLPVLENIYNGLVRDNKKPDFSNTVFVCGQHLLNTTGSLFSMLIRLGAKASNIFVVGKTYSNNRDVMRSLKAMEIKVTYPTPQTQLGQFIDCYNDDISEMWRGVVGHLKELKSLAMPASGIIVLDDGGHVLQKVGAKVFDLCEHIVGIEQTSSGLSNATGRITLPVIQVAASAIKNWIEPPMVTKKVTQLLRDKLISIHGTIYKKLPEETCFGVAGHGNIGKAIVQQLLKSPFQRIFIYDSEPLKLHEAREKYAANKNIEVVNTIDSIFTGADIIIGCTGHDISVGMERIIDFTKEPKVLISCSSKDTEFNSLLLRIQQNGNRRRVENALADVTYKNKVGHPIFIMKGGFPVNFDNSPFSVPANDIQLIRGLKLMAVLQAQQMICDWQRTRSMDIKNYQLNPSDQLDVFKYWMKITPGNTYYSEFADKELSDIEQCSGGEKYHTPENSQELVPQNRLRAGM